MYINLLFIVPIKRVGEVTLPKKFLSLKKLLEGWNINAIESNIILNFCVFGDIF